MIRAALAQPTRSRQVAFLGLRSAGSPYCSSSIIITWPRPSPLSPPSPPPPGPHLFLHKHQRRGLSSNSPSFRTAPSVAKASAPRGGGAATASPNDVVVEDEEANEKPLPFQEVAFPWRSAPHKHLSISQTIYKNTFEVLPQSYIRGLLLQVLCARMETSPEAITELLFRSTRFAFIQAVRGIFDGQAKTPPPTWEYTNDELKPPSSEWEVGYPPLADMFDGRLTEMYQDVIPRFKANKREVRLELESIHPIAMNDFRLSIGPPQGTALPEGTEELEVLGITIVLGKPPSEQEGLGVLGQWALKQAQTVPKSNFHLRFQMAVTFKCKEMFVVTNEETKEVVQGEEGVMREVEHVARFSIEFDRRAQLTQDWRLVDIDGWSEGSEYRVTTKGVEEREGGGGGGRKRG